MFSVLNVLAIRNIAIARPYNYTGIGQIEHFVLPTIVNHFCQAERRIELGNQEPAMISRMFVLYVKPIAIGTIKARPVGDV